jgi:fructose-bisphosphate aldolase, class I
LTRAQLPEVTSQAGKRARLGRILFRAGLGNGTAMLLPYDHGLEHGPQDFFANPQAADPRYIIRLAEEAGFNGIAMQIGMAERFTSCFSGEVPLVLKLNGKTNIPHDDSPVSPVNATVEDAVRLGAEAVGYTLYVGSPGQVSDLVQLRQVRQDAMRFGMPLIIWAYPRGSAIDAKGGRDSLYAIDYAARTASELGADVVKINFPKLGSGPPGSQYPDGWSAQDAMNQIVRSATGSLVLCSGGAMDSAEAVLEKARVTMEAGGTGIIFGRNMWQRDHADGLRFAARLRELLERYPAGGAPALSAGELPAPSGQPR